VIKLEYVLKLGKDKMEIINRETRELIDKLKKGETEYLDVFLEYVRILHQRNDLVQSLLKEIKKEDDYIKKLLIEAKKK